MPPDTKKISYGELICTDRLSDLPDSILHHIISFLGTEEACRTSILSKRWVHIWSTGLVLDFSPSLFISNKDANFNAEKLTNLRRKETVDRLVNFTEITMRRYSEENLSIRNIRFQFPIVDQNMAAKVDGWLGIAVRNNAESLLVISSDDTPSYELPAILFSAKSLITLDCSKVRVSYFRSLELISLQSLVLMNVDIDEYMLQNIIKSCPLKTLELKWCSGFQNISITRYSSLELLDVAMSIPAGGTIVVDTPSFRCFSYEGYMGNDSWLFNLTPASMKNLRKLTVGCVVFKDDIFEKFVSELTSIKKMMFFDCVFPKQIRIASKKLKKMRIVESYELSRVVIDAPELNSFKYTGDLKQLSSVIGCPGECNNHLCIAQDEIETQGFHKLRKLLSTLKCCKVLELLIFDKIEFDKDRVSKIQDGMPSGVQELKLSLSRSITDESSLLALIDGLFWSCRPDILSFSIELEVNNTMFKNMLEIMEKKVECWKDPLKGIDIKGANRASLFCSRDFDLRFQLSW